MATNKEQIEELKNQLHILEDNLRTVQLDIDYLKYRRIPDLERRTEHGTNHDNH